MTVFEAFLLGLIQGLTEFLPVSSSGHLELGAHFLNIKDPDNLKFTLTVHAATVLSTIVVFRKDILRLAAGGLKFRNNEETGYIARLLFSAIPIAIVGLFFKTHVEGLFTENLLLVGGSLLITASLLGFAHFRKNDRQGKISYGKSFVIGLSQAFAVIPGISRSGATIATGLLLGIDRKDVARFSFLMILVPILGAFILDIFSKQPQGSETIGLFSLVIGFAAAFLSGLFACKLMIRLVTRGNLIYFSIYCLIIALIAIFAG
jgi:undecaprenyl-diphosphatase